jgi:hypothetical protein
MTVGTAIYNIYVYKSIRTGRESPSRAREHTNFTAASLCQESLTIISHIRGQRCITAQQIYPWVNITAQAGGEYNNHAVCLMIAQSVEQKTARRSRIHLCQEQTLLAQTDRLLFHCK